MKNKAITLVLVFVSLFSFLFVTYAAIPDLRLIVQQLLPKIENLKQEDTTLENGLEETTIFTKTLKKGVIGDQVRRLQEFFKQFPDIYSEVLVDGYFETLTANSVKIFPI